jgi:hypothetical protein
MRLHHSSRRFRRGVDFSRRTGGLAPIFSLSLSLARARALALARSRFRDSPGDSRRREIINERLINQTPSVSPVWRSPAVDLKIEDAINRVGDQGRRALIVRFALDDSETAIRTRARIANSNRREERDFLSHVNECEGDQKQAFLRERCPLAFIAHKHQR